jgi:tetratricopeptide (TPR) repeat protein
MLNVILNLKTERLIFFFILLALPSVAQQEMDSLKNLLHTTPKDTTRVKILSEVAFIHWANNPLAGKQYAEEAIHLADSLNYDHGRVRAYKSLGVLAWAMGNLEQAIQYYQKSLTIAEKIKDEEYAAKIYNNMAMIYSRLNNYQDALLFYRKALAYDEKTANKKGIALSLNNIGFIFIEMGEYQLSLDALTKSLSIYRAIKNEENIGQTLNNLGLLYSRQKNYNTALPYYTESEKFYTNAQNKRGLAILYANMGNAYVQLKLFERAELFFQKSLTLSLEIGNTEIVSQAYLYISRLDSARGDYQHAFRDYHEYIKLRDKIFQSNHVRELNDFKTKVEISEKEKENALLRNQTMLQDANLRQRNYLLSLSIVLFLSATFIAILYYRYYNNKLAANEKIRKVNEQIQSVNDNLENLVHERSEQIKIQNQRLKEYAFFNAHKVRGPLARILGIIQLIKIDHSLIESEKLLDKLEDASNELDKTIGDINSILEATTRNIPDEKGKTAAGGKK